MDWLLSSAAVSPMPLELTVRRTTLKVSSLWRGSLHRPEERGHYGRIELSVRAAPNFLYGLRNGHSSAIGSAGSHSIKGIGHSQDSGLQWYIPAGYDLVKTAAIVMIMVVLDHLGYFPVNHWPYNAGSNVSMSHDVLVLFERQLAGLILDSLVNGNLPNVVQQASPAQVFHVLRG